jgi:NAD(P)-dependent dehydrogenase (short-subunit alcohol dehydrogenase family)
MAPNGSYEGKLAVVTGGGSGMGRELVRQIAAHGMALATCDVKAPLSAAQAATIILEGVSSGAWRILVGDDAKMLDERVRAKPESAYDYQELFGDLIAQAQEQAAQEA